MRFEGVIQSSILAAHESDTPALLENHVLDGSLSLQHAPYDARAEASEQQHSHFHALGRRRSPQHGPLSALPSECLPSQLPCPAADNTLPVESSDPPGGYLSAIRVLERLVPGGIQEKERAETIQDLERFRQSQTKNQPRCAV